MVERQDIDALLISALYGELTPSEETRLAAHLDSHPGDRSALADLTHARTLVRESRLFQVQLEPPQSVSTLLMNEATRCAPKPEVGEGWFARFVRSFAAHPAMAAAAMLVIVLGVATFVTKRSGDQYAESTAPASQTAIQTQDQTVQEKMAGDSPATMGSGSAVPPSAGSAAADHGAFESNADSFRVALDEGKDAPADKKAEKQKRDEVSVTKPTTERQYNSKLAKEQEEVAVATKKKPQGIELRAQQATPKDFEDDARKGKDPEAKNELAFGDNDGVADRSAPESAPKTGSSRGGEGGGGSVSSGTVVGGAAPGTADNRRMDPSPSPAPAQPSTTATASRPTPPRATTTSPPPPAAPKAEPRRDAPAKTVDRNATARAAGPAEDKPADPQLAWARDQHNALIAQVRAGECKKAATIATSISNRAPAYYQQNVETDRSVKACIAYINSERERDAEQRSERARANQKRSVNEPAPAKATDATK